MILSNIDIINTDIDKIFYLIRRFRQ